MALYIGSYQARSSRKMLLIQMMGSVVYAAHFFMLHANSGALIQAITAFNLALLSFEGHDESAFRSWRGWKWLFCTCYIISMLVAWQGIFDLLPCVSSIATTLAAWTRNGKKIRMAKLCVSIPGWLIYDVIEHSYAGIVTQLIGMGSVLISFARYGAKALDQKN